MPEYEVGERVEVFDPDRMRWCAGTVQDVMRDDEAELQPHDLIVTRSDSEFEHGLPLLFAVQVQASGVLMRRYVGTQDDA